MANYVTRYGIEDDNFNDALMVGRETPTVVEDVLGQTLSDLALIHLSGVFKNGTLYCKRVMFPYGVSPAQQSPALLLRSVHPDFIIANQANEVVILLNASRVVELYVDSILLSIGAPPGLAALMVWRMVRGCAAIGINRISLWAYGGRKLNRVLPDGRRWGGYYFWPSVGFDGALENDDKSFFRDHYKYFPDKLAAQTTVRGIFDLEQGKGADFWRFSGNDTKCEFLVNPASRSMEILRARIERLIA